MVSDWTDAAYTQCRKDRRELSDIVIERGKRIAALEAENADLREQNGLLRTVVAAWAKENNVGAMTLRDVLYAVELMDTVRDAWQASGMAEKYPAELFELDTLAAERGLPLPGAGEPS